MQSAPPPGRETRGDAGIRLSRRVPPEIGGQFTDGNVCLIRQVHRPTPTMILTPLKWPVQKDGCTIPLPKG